MKILVTGCTGKVGYQVMRGLAGQGVNVRCMTRNRSAAKARGLPCGTREYVADFDKPETIEEAMSKVDAVFLLVPAGLQETKQGIGVVEAAKAAHVRKIVYLSVYMPEGSEMIPHFNSKIPIENAVRQSGIPFTILRPNNFFQNDMLLKETIMQDGIYPVPLGLIGLNRVDVRDIADCAVNALMKSDYDGKLYNIHGPDRLTGKDVARFYSTYANKEIRYSGNDLNVWERSVHNILPDWQVNNLLTMYQFFLDRGMVAGTADLERQQDLLGHSPRSFEDFVKEITSIWRSTSAAA